MTHLTSPCAQRNRLTRIYGIVTCDDGAAGEVQLGSAPEDAS